MRQRRSGEGVPAQVDWVGGVPDGGVGGRHRRPRVPGRGGGYLPECDGRQLRETAGLRELVDMGLPAIWLDVAREIGVEAFLRMWALLDAEQSLWSDNASMLEMSLRRFASWRRYQRNRYVETLAAVGLSPRLIRERVHVELGEELTQRHIGKLVSRRKVRTP